jgi:hypothetical protein
LVVINLFILNWVLRLSVMLIDGRLLLVVLLKVGFKRKRGLQETSCFSMVKSINCFEIMYIIFSNLFDLSFY